MKFTENIERLFSNSTLKISDKFVNYIGINYFIIRSSLTQLISWINFEYSISTHANFWSESKETLSSKEDLEVLSFEINSFVGDVLGLTLEKTNSDSKLAPVMDLVLDIRKSARENKDWTTSDKIRDGLAVAGIDVKDGKEGSTWN